MSSWPFVAILSDEPCNRIGLYERSISISLPCITKIATRHFFLRVGRRVRVFVARALLPIKYDRFWLCQACAFIANCQNPPQLNGCAHNKLGTCMFVVTIYQLSPKPPPCRRNLAANPIQNPFGSNGKGQTMQAAKRGRKRGGARSTMVAMIIQDLVFFVYDRCRLRYPHSTHPIQGKLLST